MSKNIHLINNFCVRIISYVTLNSITIWIWHLKPWINNILKQSIDLKTSCLFRPCWMTVTAITKICIYFLLGYAERHLFVYILTWVVPVLYTPLWHRSLWTHHHKLYPMVRGLPVLLPSDHLWQMNHLPIECYLICWLIKKYKWKNNKFFVNSCNKIFLF